MEVPVQHDNLDGPRRTSHPGNTPRSPEIEANNRRLFLEQLSSGLADTALDISHSKPHSRLKVMGGTENRRRRAPALSLDHNKDRGGVHPGADPQAIAAAHSRPAFDTIHVDQSVDLSDLRLRKGENLPGRGTAALPRRRSRVPCHAQILRGTSTSAQGFGKAHVVDVATPYYSRGLDITQPRASANEEIMPNVADESVHP